MTPTDGARGGASGLGGRSFGPASAPESLAAAHPPRQAHGARAATGNTRGIAGGGFPEDDHAQTPGPRGEGAPTFLVERYWPGVTADALAAALRRGKREAEAMTAEGIAVRHVSSTLVPEDELVLCLFEAPSAQAVAEASARASMPFDRIVQVSLAFVASAA